MSFTRTVSGFRRVPTLHGDTLQKIAARELGDATQWYRLIYLNGLHAPYITDDPAQAGNGVILAGDTILLPAAGNAAIRSNDPDNVYGDDIALAGGRLRVENGDLAIVGGVANVSQALSNRVRTQQGELRFHPRYGCSARQLIGHKNGPGALAAAGFVKRSLATDYRVRRVPDARATVEGDAVRIAATVEVVTGEQLEVSA
ncbi:MAG TPA: hypothetical protein VFM97_00580 [Gammaproteobacteria bacterium]|nr:hypothetical protein [Gammaproteobacteria bacterium]